MRLHRLARPSRSAERIAVPARRRTFTRWMAAVASAGLAVAGVAVVAPPSQAVAATSETCGFATAGTGTYASTLCWFDMSSYNAAQAAGGQQFAVSIPGGYTLSFTITSSGGSIAPHAFPTYGGSYLGNNGHYTGVPGKPALYQTQSGATTTSTLSNITLTDSSGTSLKGFALVGADAESTDANESLSWRASSPINSLNPVGNACGGGFSGAGTTTVTCVGNGASPKTGDAIVAATNPSFFTQTMVGGGLEGFAFGVLLSSVELNKAVSGGYAGDSFGLSVADSTGTTLATANTNGGTSASTGMIPVVVDSSGSDFRLSEAATSGLIGNYTQAWNCTRNGASDPSLPTGAAGTSATVHVGIGDTVVCGITNTGLTRSLTLEKHAGTPNDVNGDGLVDAGDTIQYTFDVINHGSVPMTNIGVADPKIGSVTCPQTTLPVGGSEICSADKLYTITAGDDRTGAVDNTATATGNAVGSTEAISSGPSSTTTPTTAPAPSLAMLKSADPSGTAAYTPNQLITYHFTVTNVGNVTMNAIAIDETAFSGTGTLSPAACPSSTLVPGAQEVCTAAYRLTQADVDARQVTNTAVVNGTPAGTGTPVSSDPSTVKIPETPAPGISVAKTSDPGTVSAAGQRITYSFKVTNTGNVTLSGVHVNDTDFSGSAALSPISCPETTLVAGQAQTCTASYTVTQADVNVGTISNTATATGTPPIGDPIVSASSTSTVTAIRTPALTLVKTANVDAAEIGQTVTFSFKITNTGNVTIENPSVTETDFAATGELSPISCPQGVVLQPGDGTTCTATYTVVQLDVDHGSITNTATATGTPPVGTSTPTSPSSTVTVSTSPHPALAVVKTADAQQVTKVGQVVTYNFAVTNTGNVDIAYPKINEGRFTGHGTLSPVTCPGPSILPPGQTLDCTATYAVVAADLASGGTLSNTATVTGTLPNLDPLTSDPSTVTVKEVPAAPTSPGLASTGSDAWTAGLVGLGLVVLGLLAVAAAWLQRLHRLG